MHLATYIGIVHEAEKQMAKELRRIGEKHSDEPDIEHMCEKLAKWSEGHIQGLQPFIQKYSEDTNQSEPDRLKELFSKSRTGSLGLLRDLHDLWLVSQEIRICYKVIIQAAQGLRDSDLETNSKNFQEQTNRQDMWLRTRMKQAAPQILIVG